MKKLKLLLTKLFKFSIVTGMFLGLLYGAYLMGKTNEIYATSIDSLPAKIEKLKDDLVMRLSRDCEIKGKKETDDLITFDSNHVASLGVMQFQVKTVQAYEKSIYGKIMNGQEAISLANDPIQARALAKAIIFQTNAGTQYDWVNCTRKYNLQAEVDIINKLSK